MKKTKILKQKNNGKYFDEKHKLCFLLEKSTKKEQKN